MSVNVMKEIQAFEKAQVDYKASQPRAKVEKKLMTGNVDNVCRDLIAQTQSMLPGNVRRTLKDQADLFAKSDIPDRLMPEAMRHLTQRRFAEWKTDIEVIRGSLRSVRQRLERESNPFAAHEAAYTRYLMEMQVVGAPTDSEDVLAGIKAAVDGSDIGAVQFWAKHGRTLFDRASGKASLSDFLKSETLLNEGISLLRDSKQRAAHERLSQLAEYAHELENSLRTTDFVREPTIFPEPRDRFESESGLAEKRWLNVAAKARYEALKTGKGDTFVFDETVAVHSLVDDMLDKEEQK